MTQNDQKILDIIERLRERHHACTMRSVATTMKLSPTYVTTRLQLMKDAGIVDWTDMPGSLHRVTVDVLAPVVAADFATGARSGRPSRK
jgi:DNA-binding IclR family transcriptional regulator